jgi:hypothetical protein
MFLLVLRSGASPAAMMDHSLWSNPRGPVSIRISNPRADQIARSEAACLDMETERRVGEHSFTPIRIATPSSRDRFKLTIVDPETPVATARLDCTDLRHPSRE